MAADFTAQLLSPYQLNPLGLNPLAPDPRAGWSTSSACGATARSRCSSPRPTCAAPRRGSSATPSCRPTRCSPRPACRSCIRRSRSTARLYWDGGFVSNPPLGPAGRALPRARPAAGADQPARPRGSCRRAPATSATAISEIVFGRAARGGARAARRAQRAARARRSAGCRAACAASRAIACT